MRAGIRRAARCVALVDASQNLFFFESFIDELAQELRQEPLTFRRQLLRDNPRALRVLDAAAKLARWDEELPKGHGRGIAFLRGYGSLTAQVAEVSVARRSYRRASIAFHARSTAAWP